MISVAGTLAKTGQYQRAETVARSITDDVVLQSIALRRVAAALADSGQHQQAEAVARSITRPDTRSQALAEVAMALARTGEIQAASRITAEICAIGSWVTAVGPALLLEPSTSAIAVRLVNDKIYG